MKTKFNESKCAINDSKKAYAQKKIDKLDRFFRNEPEAVLTVKSEKKNCRVELTVYADKTMFRAEESSEDMLAAIDKTVSAIERQIHKYKTRLNRRLREGLDVAAVSAEPQEEPEEEEFQVVRKKTVHFKPMSVEEAILQMNLLGHSFFAFRDQETNEFSVVYARNDGGYGLIEDDE